MGEDVDGHTFDIFDGLNDQTSADEPDHPGSFDKELSEETVVHLLQVPLTLALLSQLRANYPEVVRHMLVLVLIPQDHCMEVEHGELETLPIFKTTDILRKPHEMVIQDNRQKIGIIIFENDILLDGLGVLVDDLGLILMVLIGSLQFLIE